MTAELVGALLAGVAMVGGVFIYIARTESSAVAAALKAHVDGCEIRERQHDERHADVKDALKQCNDKLDRLLEARR